MTAIEFYRLTTETLENMAKNRCVKDLEKYYVLTDFLAFPQLNNMSEPAQAYMQIAFHGQNATLISNIVRFEENYDAIAQVLCDFEPKSVLAKYFPQGCSREAAEKKLLAAFAEKNISSNIQRSTKRPNAVMAGYVRMLLDAAVYFSAFSSKQKIVEDLKKHYTNNDVKSLVTYFRSKIQSRFSIALTCDFLKEYSEEFDLPKPDIHIKDTLCAFKGLEENYYRTEKREYECIRHVQTLVEEINAALNAQNEESITVYQLDRMIWLVCANKFFLDDNVKNSKDAYLAKITAKSLSVRT